MKISIVTITKNNGAGLKVTVENIRSQTAQNWELIIVDGASQDNTHDIAKLWSPDSRIKYFSSPDTGIYNAMNKGIPKTSGDYILFLNAGDYFYATDSLEKAILQLADCDLGYCDVHLSHTKKTAKIKTYPNHLTWRFWLKQNICHQVVFFRRTIFSSLGKYDERFFVSGDYEYFLRCFKDPQIKFKHIDTVLTNYDMGGMSANPDNYPRLLAEYYEIQKTHAPWMIRQFVRVAWSVKYNTLLRQPPFNGLRGQLKKLYHLVVGPN